eukprot:m.165573 g.165573  ORF g.165573 m.165573 type:complete len:352 (-) comp17739_c1_seq3:115-1170(-)
MGGFVPVLFGVRPNVCLFRLIPFRLSHQAHSLETGLQPRLSLFRTTTETSVCDTNKPPPNERLPCSQVGYKHFDCASFYDNEAEIGKVFGKAFGSGGGYDRSEYHIVSKLPQGSHLGEDVRPRLEKTLRDLQLDYLDNYLIHWPAAWTPDSYAGETVPVSKGTHKSNRDDGVEFEFTPLDVPHEETWRAMEACVDAGLTRHIGVSNWSVSQLKEMLSFARIKPSVNEIELHPYQTQREVTAFCDANDIQVTTYSNLGRGPQLKPEGDPVLLEDPVILSIAQELDKTPAQIALRFAIQQGFGIFPKSMNRGRMTSNLQLNFELKDEHMEQLLALNRNVRFVNPDWYSFEDNL